MRVRWGLSCKTLTFEQGYGGFLSIRQLIRQAVPFFLFQPAAQIDRGKEALAS